MTALEVMRMLVMAGAIQACPTEDSNDCFWDAETQGNGKGSSFYVNATGDEIIYVSHTE